jgi:hypothetical protein
MQSVTQRMYAEARRIRRSPTKCSLLFLALLVATYRMPYPVGAFIAPWALAGILLTPLFFAWRDFASSSAAPARARVLACSGLLVTSIGCVLVLVGDARMTVVQGRGDFLGSFSDWGSELVRWAWFLALGGSALLIGGSGLARRAGLASGIMIWLWATLIGMSL